MNEVAQDFWLEQLGQAGRFNSWVADTIAPAVTGDVLEVGCGTGNFTGLLARRASSVVAVDVNPEYVGVARQRWRDNPRIKFRCCDAIIESWTSEFDTVVLLDVLEHVDDDVGFLRTLRKALRSSGTLIVKVPCGKWLYGTLDQAIGHYQRYSKKSLRRAFQNAGCPDPACTYFNRLGTLGWWINGRLLHQTTPPPHQVRTMETLIPLLRPMERLAPLPFGLSLIAVSNMARTVEDRSAIRANAS